LVFRRCFRFPFPSLPLPSPPFPSACELHGQLDGGARRAERQFRRGQEGAAEGDGHKDRAREQGSDAQQGQKGGIGCTARTHVCISGRAYPYIPDLTSQLIGACIY